MNKAQFDMFMNIINNTNEANIQEHYFKLTKRYEGLYEASYIKGGNKTVLTIGDRQTCLNNIKYCVEMMFKIN